VLAAAACSREEPAWDAARREHTPAAYADYMNRFPAGRHAGEARAAIRTLEDDAAWARADRIATPEAWQHYLGERPEGAHAARARALLVDFVASAPAPADHAGNAFDIQFGAWSDEAAARDGLGRLLLDHGTALAGMAPRVDPPGAGEVPYWRVRAGPFDEATARASCLRLIADGVSCFPARAGGT
jgi:hypothetical protein